MGIAVIATIVESLLAITRPRFFETELGFQGELLAELRARLANVGLPGDAVVEQEYQKRLRDHGIDVRPDLIVHIQTPAGGNRRQGNFAVFELNRSAGPHEASEDFENLDTVLQALDYPIGVFINIASSRTQAASYRGPFKDRIHFLAVRLRNGQVHLKHAYYEGEAVVEERRVREAG